MQLFNTPFNVLDFIILLVFLGGIYTGYKQGFILSFFKFFGVIIGIIGTKLYYKSFGILLHRMTPIPKWIESFYGDHIDDFFTKGFASNTNSYELLPFGKDLGQLQTIYLEHQTDMGQSVKSYLVSHLSELTLNLLSIVLLFVLLLVTIQILTSILDIASNLPVIRSLNKFGGVVFGVIKTFLMVSIVLILVVAVSSMSNMGQLTMQLEYSILAPYFMRYNVLLLWIGSAILGL